MSLLEEIRARSVYLRRIPSAHAAAAAGDSSDWELSLNELKELISDVIEECAKVADIRANIQSASDVQYILRSVAATIRGLKP